MRYIQSLSVYLLILFSITFLLPSQSYAQDVSDFTHMNATDFQKITLPPLSLLFENAKKSPRYEMYNVQAQIQNSLLTQTKKNILGFFSLRGSYQYGRFANDGYYSDVLTPAVSTYSSTSQNLYAVGAAVSIPLDKLFDLGPSVRRQKLAVRSAELERDMHFEEIQRDIIDCYSRIILDTNTLKLNNEAVIQATAQYEIAERNFVNGKITPLDLSNSKSAQSVTKEKYEDTRADLIKNLMLLEVISHTSLTKK
jgi:outer membrane protein TolC